MMKVSQLTLREWLLLFLLFLAATGMVSYYWLLSPLWERNLATSQQLALAEQELRVRQEWQRYDESTKASLSSLAAEQAELQAQLDGISNEQDLVEYLVELSQLTQCRVFSLEIQTDNVSLNVSAPSYLLIRSFLLAMEECPNLVPLTAVVTENQEGFSLQLQASLTLGQLPLGAGESYHRSVPFGR